MLLPDSSGIQGSPVFTVWGVKFYASSQLSVAEVQGTSSVASSIYIFKPSEIYMVERDPSVRIETDSSALFSSDEIYIRGLMRATYSVPNPKAVVRIIGVL